MDNEEAEEKEIERFLPKWYLEMRKLPKKTKTKVDGS